MKTLHIHEGEARYSENGNVSIMRSAIVDDPDLHCLARLAQRETDHIRVREAFSSSWTGMHRVDAILILRNDFTGSPDQLNIHMGIGAKVMFFGCTGDVQSFRCFVSPETHDLAIAGMLNFYW